MEILSFKTIFNRGCLLLALMNNYVFSMVMRVPKRIEPLLEYILGKKIRRISMVEPEKTMKEKFERRGFGLIYM